jgi:hypothetical protein
MSKKAIKAFPFADNDGMYQEGMDLRDYFAAKALVGILMSVADDDFAGDALFGNDDQTLIDAALKVYTFGAYRMADAMMKAREQ